MAIARKTMDVERLVTWALLDQGLGWSMYGEGNSPTGFADLGTRIDTSGIGAPNPSRMSDADALVVRAVILTLPDDTADIVIRHGRIGERPDWCEEGVGDWRQKRAANGKLAWHFEKAGDRRSPKTPVMEFVGWHPEQVELWRTTYRVWWHGLETMVVPLNARLATHVVSGPTAPREPWTQPAPVIHTPDGPLEKRRISSNRVSAEYVDIDGTRVKRSHLGEGA